MPLVTNLRNVLKNIKNPYQNLKKETTKIKNIKAKEEVDINHLISYIPY